MQTDTQLKVLKLKTGVQVVLIVLGSCLLLLTGLQFSIDSWYYGFLYSIFSFIEYSLVAIALIVIGSINLHRYSILKKTIIAHAKATQRKAQTCQQQPKSQSNAMNNDFAKLKQLKALGLISETAYEEKRKLLIKKYGGDV